jgi:hypothetical protein
MIAIFIASFVVGSAAYFRQVPKFPVIASSVQVDNALNAVGAAYALTTVLLVLLDAVFRAEGRERLVPWVDLTALCVGADAAFFLALGALDKDNVTRAIIGGGAGMLLVGLAAIAGLLWESQHPARGRSTSQPKRTPPPTGRSSGAQ